MTSVIFVFNFIVLSHSSLNNPFHFVTAVNISFDESCHFIFSDSVIMFGKPNSTIILKGVILNDAHSNTSRFETVK